MKKNVIFFAILILVIISCGKKQFSRGNSRLFEFKYSVELESAPNQKLELWIPIPQNNKAQSISNLVIDTQGLSYEVKDEYYHGNKYLYVYSDDGIKESKLITVTFNTKREEHQNIKYDNISNDKYLEPSQMVPIGLMFKNIIDDNDLSHNDMRGLYDFVLDGMHYGKPKSIDNEYYNEPWLYSNEEYGINKVSRDKVVDLYKQSKIDDGSYTFGNGNSLYACDIGVGNCTDYHSYFISMSRTMDIPARFHMGFSIPNGNEGKIDGYHCWADYYINDKGWYPVDISEADKDHNRIDYFFGTVCNNRVEMMVGRDFNLGEYEANPVNLFIYPLLEIDDKESKAFTKKFSYRNL